MWAPLWVVALSFLVLLPATFSQEQCINAECKCDGYDQTPGGDGTQCGCWCRKLQNANAVAAAGSYTHTVCHMFNGERSCCAHERIEAQIRNFAVEWGKDSRFTDVCRQAWEELLCNIYCDPDLADGGGVTPQPLTGFKCDDPDARLKPFEFDFVLALSPVQYKHPPELTIEIPNDDCKEVERYCNLAESAGVSIAIEGYFNTTAFNLPILASSTETLSTRPTCQRGYGGLLGGVNKTALRLAKQEMECLQECSGSPQQDLPTADMLLPIDDLCGDDCGTTLPYCTCNSAHIEDLVQQRYGMSRVELCDFYNTTNAYNSKRCKDRCGVVLNPVGPQLERDLRRDRLCINLQNVSAECNTLLLKATSMLLPPADEDNFTQMQYYEDEVTELGKSADKGLSGVELGAVLVLCSISLVCGLVFFLMKHFSAARIAVLSWFRKDDDHGSEHDIDDEQLEVEFPPEEENFSPRRKSKKAAYWDSYEAEAPPSATPGRSYHGAEDRGATSKLLRPAGTTPGRSFHGATPGRSVHGATPGRSFHGATPGRSVHGATMPVDSFQEHSHNEESNNTMGSTGSDDGSDGKNTDEGQLKEDIRNETPSPPQADVQEPDETTNEQVAIAEVAWSHYLELWETFLPTYDVTNAPATPAREEKPSAPTPLSPARSKTQLFRLGELRYNQIPWLPIMEEEGIAWSNPAVVACLKCDLLKLSAIWHPDKFQQKFGVYLHEADRERILAKVVKISQTINESRTLLKEYLAPPSAETVVDIPPEDVERPDIAGAGSGRPKRRRKSL